MHEPRRCARCDQPARDTGILCDRCIGILARALGDVAALTAASHDLTTELVVTFARLGRLGDNAGRRSAETPVPYDARAREAYWILENTLSTWARVLLDVDGHTRPASSRPAEVAGWLLGRLEQIRHHEAADEIADEILAAVRQVEHVVDRSAVRWYAGPCGEGGCATDLYAATDARQIVCPGCGHSHDVAARKQWLIEAAEDTLAHAELIAQALTSLGQPLTPSMIRGYAHRNRVLAKSVDLLGRPLYRVGDVIDVHSEVLSRRADRDARSRCA